MTPYVLTSSPAGLPSSSLTSTASLAHLALSTPTSQAPLLSHASSTLAPTHSLVGLPKDWTFPTGCSFPGSFSPPFARSDGFPTSRFSRGWDTGSSCPWFNASTSTATSTSSLAPPTSGPPVPAKANLSTNAIVGIAVGAGVVAILLAAGLIFCIMRRRRRCDASDSAHASLLPVAYPIRQQHGPRSTSGSRTSSSPASELHLDTTSERNVAGAVESRSLANCSVVPRLSVSSPLPGGVEFVAPGVPDGPSRAEKALMQLRERGRWPTPAHEAAAPPTDGVGTTPESCPPDGVGARSDMVSGDGMRLAGGPEGGRDVGLAADHASDLDSGSDMDMDSEADYSRTTLPPPYSSHPSFEQPGV